MTFPSKMHHYCREPIEKLERKFYAQNFYEKTMTQKPNGLWVSIEDFEGDQTWKTWCEAEGFEKEGLSYCYQVKLKCPAKTLWLKTPQDIIDFGLKYADKDPFSMNSLLIEEGRGPCIYWIKWPEIMKEYDALFIAPYQWDCRLEDSTGWYYGWDCASGCIWNIDIIQSLTEVPTSINFQARNVLATLR